MPFRQETNLSHIFKTLANRSNNAGILIRHLYRVLQQTSKHYREFINVNDVRKDYMNILRMKKLSRIKLAPKIIKHDSY